MNLRKGLSSFVSIGTLHDIHSPSSCFHREIHPDRLRVGMLSPSSLSKEDQTIVLYEKITRARDKDNDDFCYSVIFDSPPFARYHKKDIFFQVYAKRFHWYRKIHDKSPSFKLIGGNAWEAEMQRQNLHFNIFIDNFNGFMDRTKSFFKIK